MTGLVPILVGVLVVVFVALLPLAVFGPARWRAKTRADLVLTGSLAVAGLVYGWAFGPWSTVTVIPWFVLVALTALGLAGLVVRWPELPLHKPGRSRTWAVVWMAANLAALVVIVALVVWPSP